MRGGRRGLLPRTAACAALFLASVAMAQDGGGVSVPGSVALRSGAETLVIDSVRITLQGSTGDIAADARLADRIRASIGLRAGDRLSSVELEVLPTRLSGIPGVVGVRPALQPVGGAGRTTLLVAVQIGPPVTADPGATGMLAERDWSAFPTIWRQEGRALRFILNTGTGVFSDGNPWFGHPATFTLGNPLVENPSVGTDTGTRATWAEGWIEFGIGGVSRIGDTNAAVYGAVTVMAPAAIGQDIFRNDFRRSADIEKAFVGFLYGDPDRRRSLDLSLGRLNFTLNDGFLISQFGSQWNAGPRPGIYLATPTTQDFGAVAEAKLNDWTATAFYLDPNEYEPLETDTRIAGVNLRYAFSEPFLADLSVFQAIASDFTYRTPVGPIGSRDGLTTLSAHLRWADRERLPGFWLEAEAAHQSHANFKMDAHAGYATVGYLARDLPWTPSLSFRASTFSGDDPATATYERFDPLYSGGLGEWLQGISLGKVLSPANRHSQRIRLNLAPNPRLNLTFDAFWHQADQLNNIGGHPAMSRLSSSDLGREVQVTARWALSDNLYLVGVLGRAFPGKAITQATGGTATDWTTMQAQVFWAF